MLITSEIRVWVEIWVEEMLLCRMMFMVVSRMGTQPSLSHYRRRASSSRNWRGSDGETRVPDPKQRPGTSVCHLEEWRCWTDDLSVCGFAFPGHLISPPSYYLNWSSNLCSSRLQSIHWSGASFRAHWLRATEEQGRPHPPPRTWRTGAQSLLHCCILEGLLPLSYFKCHLKRLF